MRGAALAALLLTLPFPATTEPESLAARVAHTLEMPAHRALMGVVSAPDTTLAPFTTDGCSGGLSTTWSVVADLFPDFAAAHDGQPPWEACCVAHDRHYHDAGGATDAETSYHARLAADDALRACVIDGGEDRIAFLADHYGGTEDQVRLAYRTIGDSMFTAVRFGGAPCTGLPWRWGYGYPGCLPGFP
jgi:hypothetical protein